MSPNAEQTQKLDGNELQKSNQKQIDGDELQQNQQKKLRRIHERQQMPTDKAQLIQYLSQRIKQAEQALNDTEQLLESEVNERQKVSKSLDERNRQLQTLYEVDQKGLPQKIKEKLTEILTQTINQKIEADEQLTVEKNKNYEYKSRYDQLKWIQTQRKHKLEQLNSSESEFNSEIFQFQQKISTHERQLKESQQQYESVKQKKQSLQDKYLQMKVALERMTDIKAVINRFFSNEDLFDEKMDLKEQKVTRVSNLNPTKQTIQKRQPSRDGRNITKLKPLNNSRKKQINNEDEDFWKGDYSSKNRNY